MDPNNVMSWVLYGGLIIGIGLAFVALYASIGAWLKPRLARVGTGRSAKQNQRQYCCPAGLGCNDPDSQWRQCRRQGARDVAQPDEFIKLEEAWSAFVGSTSPTAKRRNLAAYEVTRDEIIKRHLSEALSGKGARKQLLAGLPEELDGEVQENKGGKKESNHISSQW